MNTVEDRLRAALTAKADAVSLADDRVELSEPATLLALPATHHHRRWPALVVAVAAAVVLVTVGATVLVGHNRHPNQLAAAGRTDVPWSQVGPDWTLAVVPGSAADPDLDLISPTGVRYLICQLPAPFVSLQPWKLGTEKAIVAGNAFNGPDGIEYGKDVLIVDLRTGDQTRTSVSSEFSTIQFASPGLDSLLVSYPSSMQLVSVRTGRALARYPLEGPVFGSTLSPDGSQVVAGGPAGLVVFDRASGRRTRSLASPSGYGACQVLRWLPATSQILAKCFARTGNALSQNLTFAADGRRAPQPDDVPAGWQEIRLAAGVVAFQPAAHSTPGPLEVVFARVDRTGRLTHLSVPAELEQGHWDLAGATADLLLFDDRAGLLHDQDVLRLAAWNPLTGTFTVLLSGTAGQRSAFSHTSWQQYSPPTVP